MFVQQTRLKCKNLDIMHGTIFGKTPLIMVQNKGMITLPYEYKVRDFQPEKCQTVERKEIPTLEPI